MVDYALKSPGVYLQQVAESGPPGLTTGVPAFLGAVASPPDAGPFLLDGRAFAELDSQPAAWAGGHLRAAVRGFFENGGQRCLVVPMAGAGALSAALAQLDALEGFDLVVAPDLASLPPADLAAAQVAVLKACANRGDCFALLDTPAHDPLAGGWHAGIAAHRAALAAEIDAAAGSESEREVIRIQGAIYTPWCRVRDGALEPVSGHVAGVLARVDDGRGAHKAPANEVVEGLVDLEVRLDAAGQEAVNPGASMRFNCLRPFPGRGIRIWGARTLSADPTWTHVSARRTVVSLRRIIDLTMASMAFEPNDLRLWIRIQREIGGFLNTLFERGALKGASAAEAYQVKCDAETNPPAVRDAGQVVTEIGLALAKPRELIVVRLTHDAAGVTPAAP